MQLTLLRKQRRPKLEGFQKAALNAFHLIGQAKPTSSTKATSSTLLKRNSETFLVVRSEFDPQAELTPN
jgi:hypothetical protein